MKLAKLATVGIGAAIIAGVSYLHNLPYREKSIAPVKITSLLPTTITQEVIDSVMRIESHGNHKAQRYEPHINDTSYGAMQILTQTARLLERKYADLPRLGKTPEEVKQSLLQLSVNRAYGERLLQDNFKMYENVALAVAAYNAGTFAPRNARIQQQLNDLLRIELDLDGDLGSQSRKAISSFQELYNKEHLEKPLVVDGKIGEKTYQALQEIWKQQFPTKQNPKGIIPQNKRTPYHVLKFTRTLEEIVSSKSS